jgi:hypothetical protein
VKTAIVVLGVLFFQMSFAGQYLQVMGELTGAGSRYSINDLAGFVQDNTVIMKKDCSNILVNKNAFGRVSDVSEIVVNGIEIKAKDLDGFLVNL